MPRVAKVRTSLVAIGVALTLLAGCAAASPSAPPSTHASTPSARPAPSASQAATAWPTPAASATVVAALPDDGQPLFPGRYTTQFQPALQLTIDRQVNIDCAPGYRCRGDVDVNAPSWLGLEFGHDHPIDINVMRFDQLYDPTHPRRLIRPPADLAEWIAAWPGLTVTDRKAVQIGGVDATQLDVRAGSTGVRLGPSGQIDPPALGFGPHQLRRLTVLRLDGTAVFVQIASVNEVDETPARMAAAIDILQPIVDSISWQ